MGLETRRDIKPVVITTLLEHNSNELPWRKVSGSSLIRLPFDADGFLDLNQLEMLLAAYNENGQHGRKRIKLVAVSGASNVLGVFIDLSEISRIAHRYGASLLVDAAQLVAHRRVDKERYGIDYLAFSAHKAYAPFGAGVLMPESVPVCTTKRDFLVSAIQFNEDWFPGWEKDHPRPRDLCCRTYLRLRDQFA